MTPNVYLHSVFGKLLFAAGDVAIGALIYRIIPLLRDRPKAAPSRSPAAAQAKRPNYQKKKEKKKEKAGSKPVSNNGPRGPSWVPSCTPPFKALFFLLCLTRPRGVVGRS
jgi:hypothetical protein